MVALTQSPQHELVEATQAEAPKLRHVIWYKDPGLRKLYFFGTMLCLACATTGYDGYVSEFNYCCSLADRR